MKYQFAVAVFGAASLAYAQQSRNELTKGGCKGTVMIFARGSTEPGNVGMIIGPPLFTALSKALGGDLAIEGVTYAAGLGTNMGPGGADPKGVTEATRLFNLASTQCPNAVLLGGGYSQGAAVMHRSVEKLPKNVQDRIAGVILYGDTQNKQDKAHIKNFPEEKSKVFCNPNDGVCSGALNVNAGHLSYTSSIAPGAEWLASRVKALKAGGSSPSAPAAAEAPMADMPGMTDSPKAAKSPKGAKGAASGHSHGSARMFRA